jgi:hypothetical protein
MGVEAIGKPRGYGKQQADLYLSRDYHQPSDEVRPDWDYAGAVQDAQMGLMIALQLASGPGGNRAPSSRRDGRGCS